jgi:hypothetical protein
MKLNAQFIEARLLSLVHGKQTDCSERAILDEECDGVRVVAASLQSAAGKRISIFFPCCQRVRTREEEDMPQAMGRMRRSKLSTSEASDDEGTALRSLEENSSGEQAQQVGGAKAWLSRAAERVKQAARLASSSSSPNSGTLLAFYRQHSEQFKALLPYLWPSGKPGLRARLVCSLAFLILSKVASTGSPIATKYTVDSLTSNNWNTATLGVIIYGSLRFFSNLASEVRDNLFQPLSAYASRRISLLVYDHVQSLSLRFHINRRTGALLNAVNRGSTAYSELLQRLAFSIFPIILEVTLASAYLFSAYTYAFGAITLGSRSLIAH